MSRQLKKSIQQAFQFPVPNPKEKDRFLRALPQPSICMFQFILIQAAYLRKRTLLFSILLLFPVLTAANWMEPYALWIVSAFVPFLGFLMIAESTRSMACKMDEFEMSARFSLKSVVLARMSVLGLFDFLVLCCLILFCHKNSSISLFETGIYLFVPYLLTANISLWIVRHFRCKEAVYACMSAAALVSTAGALLHLKADFLYRLSYFREWLLLFTLLVIALIYGTYCTIKQTEELSWSL